MCYKVLRFNEIHYKMLDMSEALELETWGEHWGIEGGGGGGAEQLSGGETA